MNPDEPPPPPSEPAAKVEIPMLFPVGHFYSPIVDPATLVGRADQLWDPGRATMPGVDLRPKAQLKLLRRLSRFAGEIDYPAQPQADPSRFYYDNDQFPALDADVLYTMLRHFAPRRLIEIGSGWSSLVTADVNVRHRAGAMRVACVEPFPKPFLLAGVPGISELRQQRVEDVELTFFDKLAKNDVLFIDSSHVAKTGSDVNYLFFEVLPRLRRGVLVHIHDIFFPDEYPKKWVLEEGRSWNEQYLVRAFLQFNQAWQVLWCANYMVTRHRASTSAVFPRDLHRGGGSLWLRRRR